MHAACILFLSKICWGAAAEDTLFTAIKGSQVEIVAILTVALRTKDKREGGKAFGIWSMVKTHLLKLITTGGGPVEISIIYWCCKRRPPLKKNEPKTLQI